MSLVVAVKRSTCNQQKYGNFSVSWLLLLCFPVTVCVGAYCYGNCTISAAVASDIWCNLFGLHRHFFDVMQRIPNYSARYRFCSHRGVEGCRVVCTLPSDYSWFHMPKPNLWSSFFFSSPRHHAVFDRDLRLRRCCVDIMIKIQECFQTGVTNARLAGVWRFEMVSR